MAHKKISKFDSSGPNLLAPYSNGPNVSKMAH